MNAGRTIFAQLMDSVSCASRELLVIDSVDLFDDLHQAACRG
jgi:hypothetical protein